MAFAFLGTFNESQWNRLKSFVSKRKGDFPARIETLHAQLDRIGSFASAYDTAGNPIGVRVAPFTVLGKILSAYLALGGNPEMDLQVRVITDPVVLQKEDETTPVQQLSNGEILGTSGLADAASSVLISKVRKPVERDIARLTALERRFRRTVDYADQLRREIADLKLFQETAEKLGSFENLVQQVEELLDDPGYPAIYRDNGKDPHGRRVYAPFAAYEPGPARPEMEQTVRTSKGVVERGERG